MLHIAIENYGDIQAKIQILSNRHSSTRKRFWKVEPFLNMDVFGTDVFIVQDLKAFLIIQLIMVRNLYTIRKTTGPRTGNAQPFFDQIKSNQFIYTNYKYHISQITISPGIIYIRFITCCSYFSGILFLKGITSIYRSNKRWRYCAVCVSYHLTMCYVMSPMYGVTSGRKGALSIYLPKIRLQSLWLDVSCDDTDRHWIGNHLQEYVSNEGPFNMD